MYRQAYLGHVLCLVIGTHRRGIGLGSRYTFIHRHGTATAASRTASRSVLTRSGRIAHSSWCHYSGQWLCGATGLLAAHAVRECLACEGDANSNISFRSRTYWLVATIAHDLQRLIWTNNRSISPNIYTYHTTLKHDRTCNEIDNLATGQTLILQQPLCYQLQLSAMRVQQGLAAVVRLTQQCVNLLVHGLLHGAGALLVDVDEADFLGQAVLTDHRGGQAGSALDITRGAWRKKRWQYCG